MRKLREIFTSRIINHVFLLAVLIISACDLLHAVRTDTTPTDNDTLSNIKISVGILTPSFSSAITKYSVTVDATSIEITPTATDPTAEIKINNEIFSIDKTPNPIALAIGSTPITITVATSNDVKKDYVIVVNRTQAENTLPKTNDSYLSSIYLSEGALTPSFYRTITSYDTYVANDTSSIMVSATTENPNSTLTINGDTVASSDDITINLVVGPNVVQFLVQAPDTSQRSYTLVVTRSSAPIHYYESAPQKGYALCDPYNNIQIGTDSSHYFKLTAADGSSIYVKQTLQLKINELGVLVDKYMEYPLEPQITIPANTTSLDISPDGYIRVMMMGNSNQNSYGQINLVSFPNPDGLTKIADANGQLQQLQQLQQANQLLQSSSLSQGSNLNNGSGLDTGEGSYYIETNDSGSPNNTTPDGSFFGDATTYCGKLSIPTTGAIQLRTRIIGNGFLVLQQANGEYAYYSNNNGFNLVNSSDGRLMEATTGLPINPSITIPSNILIETLLIDEVGMVTAMLPDTNSPSTFGQINLATFPSPTSLLSSPFNPNLFQVTAESGQATMNAPGSDGTGTLNLYSRYISAPTIIPVMEVHDATYSYQSTPNNMCLDGKMTIEITDLLHYLKFTDTSTGNIYYKRGQQEITRDPSSGLLVDSSGFVLDPGITIPIDATQVAILPTGIVEVYVSSSIQPMVVGSITVYSTVNGFIPAAGMPGYYIENVNITGTAINSSAAGSFFGPSIAYCGGRVLEDSSNNMVSDKMTINMEIDGSCFFQLTDIDGNSAFTRNNKFIVDQNGVIREATSGLMLQPQISVPFNAVSLNITSDGFVSATLDDSSIQNLGQINLSNFTSVDSLSKSVENYFILQQSSNSGMPTQGIPGQNGCGTISFGSYGTKSNSNNSTNILFISEKDNLQKLDDALAAFAPPDNPDQPICSDQTLIEQSMANCGMDNACVDSVYANLVLTCSAGNLVLADIANQMNSNPTCFYPETAQTQMDAECNGDSTCINSFIESLSNQCGADNFVVQLLTGNNVLNLLR